MVSHGHGGTVSAEVPLKAFTYFTWRKIETQKKKLHDPVRDGVRVFLKINRNAV